MSRMLSRDDLIAFENDIAAAFNEGQIRAPVHLSAGNEDHLIDLFRSIGPQDWCFCSWRSHYAALLKGVPPAEVKSEIMAGRSISLCFPRHRFYSSAIVGGSLPIAVGVAMAIKRRWQSELYVDGEVVYVFIGDMTAETGIAHECIKYSLNHNLPIHFVVEDNGLSVCTPTAWPWNMDRSSFARNQRSNVTYYQYDTKWPHAGAGKRIQF